MDRFDSDADVADLEPTAGRRAPALRPAGVSVPGLPFERPTAAYLDGLHVVFDPGPGSRSAGGARWVVSVARAAAGHLRGLGALVSLTQEGDGSVPHPVRRLRAGRAGADLVLGLDVASSDPYDEGLGPDGRGVRLRYAPWRPWRAAPGRWAAHRLMRELVAAGARDAGVVPGLEGEGCSGVVGGRRSISLLAVFGGHWVCTADPDVLAVAVVRGIGACYGELPGWRPSQTTDRDRLTAPVEVKAALTESGAQGAAGDATPVTGRSDDRAPLGPGATHAERSGTDVEHAPPRPSWPEGADALSLRPDAAAGPIAARRAPAEPARTAGPAAVPEETSGGRREAAVRAAADDRPDAGGPDEAAVPWNVAGPDAVRGAAADAVRGAAAEEDAAEEDAEEGSQVRGPGGPGRLAEMKPVPYMYDRDRAVPASRRDRLLAGGFTPMERQRPVAEWYRPFLGPGAVYVHIPQQSSPSIRAVALRRLPSSPRPASHLPSTAVRVKKSR